MTTAYTNIKPITGHPQPAEPAFTVSFGAGKFGYPGDPVAFNDVNDLADAIEANARVMRFPMNISAEEYARKKERGPWLMRAIDEEHALATDENGAEHWHRRKGSVTVCNFLMFDADKMPKGTYARVKKALPLTSRAMLMYKSTGYGMECKGELEAFRILIQCKPVAADIAEAVTAWMRDNLARQFDGGEWDASCDQPTRIVYLPFMGEPVDAYDGDPLDCAALFTEHGLTLVKKGRDGMTREEQDAALPAFGVFAEFAAWCLDTVNDAKIVKKPDGRVALQMPGQQPEKYSDGEDAGDGWNIYPPSGTYEMAVFHSLHTVNEPSETFGIQDAIGVLAKRYDTKEPAKLYAAALKKRVSKPKTPSVNHTPVSAANSGMPAPGAAPAGVTAPLVEFTFPPSFDWPEDLDDADAPAEDASEAEQAAYAKAREQVRIQRHQHYAARYIYIARGKEIIDRSLSPNVPPLKWDEFKTDRLPEYWIDAKSKPHLYSESWLRSKNRESVHETGFLPGAPRVYFDREDGVQKVNTFYIAPFVPTTAEDRLKDFFWLVERTHPDAKEAGLFYDWLAVTFRYPSLKIPFAHVNISPAYGSGRGRLIKIMSWLLGERNVGITTPADISEDRYHDYMFRRLVTVVEEGDEDANGKRIKIAGVWNDVITSERRMLNLKYGGKYDEHLYNNVFMALNDYSLSISNGDRRIQATTGAAADVADPGPVVWGRVDSLARDHDFRNQLASWLWRRDLSDFDFRAPDKTLPARARLLMNSGTFEEQLAREILESLPCAVVPATYIDSIVAKACVRDVNKGLNQSAVKRAVNKIASTEKMVDYNNEHKNIRCRVFDPKLKRGFADVLRSGFNESDIARLTRKN